MPYGAKQHADGTAGAAWAQEEGDLTSAVMSGKVPTRLYGAKVWIGTDESKNIARIKNYDGVEKLLPNSTDNKAGFIADTELPTAVDYDALNNVQFGRLSGLAEPGSITQIPDGTHTANNPDDVPFADSIGNGLVNKGVSNATDFYFARGNNPTSLEQMNALNSNILTYHGQALTYGVDNGYHGPQEAPESGAATASGGLVPNSIGKPKAGSAKEQLTLLGGRGNFVVANFDPAKSVVQGSVYNVWNVATFKPIQQTGGTLKYAILKQPDATKGEVGPQFDDANAETGFSEKTYKDVHGYKDNLIAFSGSVNGNKIEGDAIRYDDEKGKFAGAFFGKNAEEMAGVITSAAKYGMDPKEKWGAVFGAKATVKGATPPALPGSGKPLGWKLESGQKR